MRNINWQSGEHKIYYEFSEEQNLLIKKYKEPLERKLAEEQAARYRKDPDTYRYLRSVASMLDEGDYLPYLGATGGADIFTFHELYEAEKYGVQYNYLKNNPIWLTDIPALKADRIYKITPTSLGYIVKCEIDLTDYDSW